ncbi:MAG: rhodanese-like domain-containing protein [Chloroflexi bacterium]|nr:MAG: rhodanese-like domain-containing protein [Chloroflexota bacterium]
MNHCRIPFGALLLLLLILAACSPQPSPPAAPMSAEAVAPAQAAPAELPRNPDGYVDLRAEQLQALLQDEKVTLVNVHVPYEGELPATDRFIPFDQIQNRTVELPDKDAPIVLYCRSGSMSTQAAKVLVGLGYTNVYELDGGFNAWVAAGYELLYKP